MDFDIGNLLYLVITVIVVVIGLMGRKKKSSPRTDRPGESGGASKTGFLENLEKVLTMEQEKPVYVDLQEDEPGLPAEDTVIEEVTASLEPETETTSSSQGFASEYERILKNLENSGSMSYIEGERSIDPLQVIDLEEERKGTDYFEIVRDFDPGTAVVYSAIINRIDY